MSFADLIKQAQAEVSQHTGGNNDTEKVQYPTTKHKQLFFNKDVKEVMIQLLPSADLVSTFAVPNREIFLSTKTSKGKELTSNFTLDAEINPDGVLEKAIAEWTDKEMIPSPFGGQQRPRRVYNTNVVKIVQVQVQNPQTGQYENRLVQERDQDGNLVVRVFKMPQSAYSAILSKLADPMLNPQGPNGSPYSFMDVSGAAPIKIAKPPKGQTSYGVEVYPMAKLPELGQGWESQLENLHAHAVPTEQLENGLQWVQAFIDMKNGVNPNNRRQSEQAPAQGQAPTAPPAPNPYAQQAAPTAPPTAPPVTGQYTTPPATNQYTAPTAPPVTAPPIQQPVTPAVPPTAPAGASDLSYDNVPDFGTPSVPNTPPAAPVAPATPVAPPTAPPVTPAMPAQSAPTNGQGLPDIDAQLNNLLDLNN